MGRVGYVPSLLCAEFVMGRVCHVPSLLCAELSLNRQDVLKMHSVLTVSIEVL